MGRRTNEQVFAALHTYDDYKRYRNTFKRYHKEHNLPSNTRLLGEHLNGVVDALRTVYEDTPPVPGDRINFTLQQLDVMASTIHDRQRRRTPTLNPADAYLSLRDDRVVLADGSSGDLAGHEVVAEESDDGPQVDRETAVEVKDDAEQRHRVELDSLRAQHLVELDKLRAQHKAASEHAFVNITSLQRDMQRGKTVDLQRLFGEHYTAHALFTETEQMLLREDVRARCKSDIVFGRVIRELFPWSTVQLRVHREKAHSVCVTMRYAGWKWTDVSPQMAAEIDWHCLHVLTQDHPLYIETSTKWGMDDKNESFEDCSIVLQSEQEYDLTLSNHAAAAAEEEEKELEEADELMATVAAHGLAIADLQRQVQHNAIDVQGHDGDDDAKGSQGGEVIDVDVAEPPCPRCGLPCTYAASDSVQCDCCGEWFHFACVGITESQAKKRKRWYCSSECQP